MIAHLPSCPPCSLCLFLSPQLDLGEILLVFPPESYLHVYIELFRHLNPYIYTPKENNKEVGGGYPYNHIGHGLRFLLFYLVGSCEDEDEM